MASDRPITDEQATSRAFERDDSSIHSAPTSSPSVSTGDDGEGDREVVHICKRCMTARPAGNGCPECGAPLVPIRSVRDSYLGEVVAGKYKLVEQIGSGGMGEVYLGINEPLDQRVAVKFLSQQYSANEQIIMRFLNEARSYCRVNHPNAVTLLDYGQHDDGALYIITEYVEGISLTDAISEHGPLEPSKALSVTSQCCEVLGAAHQEGVIHRDLKPDNIMLMPASRDRYVVKVLDFGIAKIVDDERAELTKTGSVFGTPEFMSPEQAEGKTADPRSDLYALGIILFYTSTGQLPFQADSQFSVLEQQINETPPNPSSVVDEGGVPEPIERVIERCLQKSREDRFEDAEHLCDALEAARERIGAAGSSRAAGGREGGSENDLGTIQLTDVVDAREEPSIRRRPSAADVVDGRAETPLAGELADLEAGDEEGFELGRNFETVDAIREKTPEPFQLPTPDRGVMPAVGAAVAVVLTAGIVGWQVWSDPGAQTGGKAAAGGGAAQIGADERRARRRLSEAHVWLDEATVSQARRTYREALEAAPDSGTSESFATLSETTRERLEKVEGRRDEFVAAVDGECARAEKIGGRLASVAPEVAGWVGERVEGCRTSDSGDQKRAPAAGGADKSAGRSAEESRAAEPAADDRAGEAESAAAGAPEQGSEASESGAEASGGDRPEKAGTESADSEVDEPSGEAEAPTPEPPSKQQESPPAAEQTSEEAEREPGDPDETDGDPEQNEGGSASAPSDDQHDAPRGPDGSGSSSESSEESGGLPPREL